MEKYCFMVVLYMLTERHQPTNTPIRLWIDRRLSEMTIQVVQKNDKVGTMTQVLQ
jgi:hypothetical protein